MAEKIDGGAEREAMVFPFRWFDTLGALGDRKLRAMFDAIGAYAARGEEPKFTGTDAALWHELKQRIDCDNARYETVCERNRRNGRHGGRPKKADGFSENPEKPKKPDADAEADAEADADADISIQKVSDDTFSPERRLGRVATTDSCPFGILPMIRLESTTLYFFTGSYRV